jgi:hypothetical protein
MMRRIERIVAAGAVVFVLIQLVPMSRSNPPITQDVAAPPQAEAILRRGCYDCHSNETRWPWYARVAPVSWLVIRDVDRGRKHVNFSTWDKYADDPETVIRKLRNIGKFSHNGTMPLWYYLPLHSEARLSHADREVLEKWASQAIATEEKREQSQP